MNEIELKQYILYNLENLKFEKQYYYSKLYLECKYKDIEISVCECEIPNLYSMIVKSKITYEHLFVNKVYWDRIYKSIDEHKCKSILNRFKELLKWLTQNTN